MERWACPRCEREFGRVNQSHVCVPAGTVDDCFAGRPSWQRSAYDAVAAHLATLGPVHTDAVRVGVFFKHRRKLAEVRPKARSLSLSVVLPRPVDDPRIARRISVGADRVWHVVKLLGPDDVDGQVRGWLTEAYHAAG